MAKAIPPLAATADEGAAATAAGDESQPPAAAGEPAAGGNNHDEPRVVKSKQFALKPMSIDEATLQLDLIGHSFFVFTNAETNDTNVVYRRNDGHFGLIEPVRQ